MTNFFQHQAAARRRTIWLVVYFILAFVSLVGVTYLLVVGIFAYPAVKNDTAVTIWYPALLGGVTILVFMLVGGCTVYKVSQLASGGDSVALLLGGTELSGSTRNLRERRLLNVVEEMAIAAGIPVPAVYVLEEEGINAFAAGYRPGEAVVGVSRGCLEYLTRDELQGVVAHEFSHILNGDMRLNIRLISLIFGIMGLAMIGSVLMRASAGRSSKGKGQIVMLGLGLYLIGSMGALFGNLIKAAVSRQREFLADASAVQFTRNPDGIGGALKKIGGLDNAANLKSPNAAEVSHMFFADALLSSRFSSMFATHPPLEQRIKRVDPNWDGEYPDVRRVSADKAEVDGPKPKRIPPFGSGLPTVPGMPQLPLPILVAGAEEVVGRVGTITPAQTAYATELRDSIPEPLLEAAREPFSARALVYCLLLDPSPDVRAVQMGRLKAGGEANDFAETVRLSLSVAALPDAARLPLIDLAIPALRRMSASQYQAFRGQIEQLASADQSIGLFEYLLFCVLERHLDLGFGRKPARSQERPTGSLAEAVVGVLSLLAWEGNEQEDAAREAFDAGMKHYVRGDHPHSILPRDACRLEVLDRKLRQLATASLGAKRRILLACVECIAHDRKATVREAELYRAIGDVLGCPIPPL